MWRIELVLSSAGMLGSHKPCSKLVFEVTTCVLSLLTVARWGQQLAGDSQSPASLLGLLPMEQGSVHQVYGKSLSRGIVRRLPQGYLSAPSCSQGFLEAGSLPAGVCSCSVNSNKAVFKDLLFHLAELGRTLECADNCPLPCAAVLESRTEPSWKGWEDESARSVERAGLAWAAAEG